MASLPLDPTLADPTRSKTARRIKRLREDAELSQDKLGEIAGVSQNTVSSWEKDKTKPDSDALAALARYFDVTTDFLCGLSDHEKALPPHYWLVDLAFIEAMRRGERPAGVAFGDKGAVAIPERFAVISSAEFQALAAEMESLSRRIERKERQK